jgi:hypothetical protein
MARFGRLSDARILRDFKTARLAFTRRIPGLKGETWGTLRVFSVHWREGLRPKPEPVCLVMFRNFCERVSNVQKRTLAITAA